MRIREENRLWISGIEGKRSENEMVEGCEERGAVPSVLLPVKSVGLKPRLKYVHLADKNASSS
jgi:hypothetical protein